jgi:YHS domain-containing protein
MSMTLARTLMRGLLPAAAGLAFSTAAWAGPQYTENGYAVSGYDPVAYFTEGEAVQGDPDIAYDYNGATWLFASEEHRDLFAANPEDYAPEYDGHCAYGVAQGGKVPGNPQVWAIVDGELYLNVNQEVGAWFAEDAEGYVAEAEENWPGLEDDAASTNASGAPVPN